MSSLRTLVLLAGFGGFALAAQSLEAEKKPVSTSAELRQLDLEDQWQFDPVVGRADPFYDREAIMRVELDIRQAQEKEAATKSTSVNPNTDILAYATAEQTHIESLVVAKKYEEAIRVSDTALKRLEKNADLPEIQAILARITTYRDQADDALTRDEAQAQFDGLGLKIEGILWSESGSRLAIIDGEPRAVGVNERVKDCVIINIDTDRVDFRFHYKRKRFEFPRYVGEDSKTATAHAK